MLHIYLSLIYTHRTRKFETLRIPTPQNCHSSFLLGRNPRQLSAQRNRSESRIEKRPMSCERWKNSAEKERRNSLKICTVGERISSSDSEFVRKVRTHEIFSRRYSSWAKICRTTTTRNPAAALVTTRTRAAARLRNHRSETDVWFSGWRRLFQI